MIRYWVEMAFAGVPNPLAQVFGMKVRGTLSREMVTALIVCHKLGLDDEAAKLEAHALAGGRPQDIAGAASQLKRLGEPVPFDLLCAIDLERGHVPDLIESFVHVRKASPQFPFEEVAERFAAGEDVIAAARQGTLESVASQSDWAVRIEYGPLSGEAVRELAAKATTAARVTVRRPGSREWEALSQVTELAGG